MTPAQIGVLVGPLYEDIEVHYPLLRLGEDGADVLAIDFASDSAYGGRFWSLALAARGRLAVPGETRNTYAGIHGMPVAADVSAEDIAANSLSALVIPGGYVADHLRRAPAVLELIREMAALGRTIAAICHGPWVLSSAGVLAKRRVTSHWVIRNDLDAAGAEWVDESVVVDDNIITAQFPSDLGAFCRAILDSDAAALLRRTTDQTHSAPISS